MFKLMTYNILNGGGDRFDLVMDAIAAKSPDFLVINEANGFEKNDNARLKELAHRVGLPHFAISLSGEGEYHTAVLSCFPFLESVPIHPLTRAGILSVVETEAGKICIVGVHLTAILKERRNVEIELLQSVSGMYKNRIIAGDLNSLSPEDGYDERMMKEFNEAQIQKFTERDEFYFSSIQKLLDYGLTDLAVAAGQNRVHTVPTEMSTDEAFQAKVRLDYVLAEGPIVESFREYRVIQDNKTNKASDHYPVVAVFE